MKFSICVFLAAVLGLSAVSGQTRNYFLASYDDAMDLKRLYTSEILYWSIYLTLEAEEMGYYYTDLIGDAIAEATNSTQGAAIASCSSEMHDLSRENVLLMDRYIVQALGAAHKLHHSVLDQLRVQNIKEYDPELFYYYHSYGMQEAYNELWYIHVSNMNEAWWTVYVAFFWNYEDLFECLWNALGYSQ